MNINFKVKHPQLTPVKGSTHASGFDFRAPEHLDIPRHASSYIEVDTGVAFEIPVGTTGLIFPRSSLGSEGLILANTVGVIDADFRDTVKVRLNRRAAGVTRIRAGERFAQIVFVSTPVVTLVQTKELSETERGLGGFGSTGKGDVE